MKRRHHYLSFTLYRGIKEKVYFGQTSSRKGNCRIFPVSLKVLGDTLTIHTYYLFKIFIFSFVFFLYRLVSLYCLHCRFKLFSSLIYWKLNGYLWVLIMRFINNLLTYFYLIKVFLCSVSTQFSVGIYYY